MSQEKERPIPPPMGGSFKTFESHLVGEDWVFFVVDLNGHAWHGVMPVRGPFEGIQWTEIKPPQPK
jgi:hypothetical protein